LPDDRGDQPTSEEDRLRFLLRELNHRSQNLLAVVQSILRLTQAPDTATFIQNVEARITALARVHAIVDEERDSHADLLTLVRNELAPFGLDERVVVSGDNLSVTPKAAQAMAMVLHELATNAAKYGALSAPEGRIAVRWESGTGPSGELVLRWTERNGPPVAAPLRRGFGSKLMETMMNDLNGRIDKDWRAKGLACTVRLPLEGCLSRHAHPPHAIATLPAARPLPARNILVFETDTIVAQAFRHLFRVMGCEPIGPVTSLSEALRLARTAPIDVAILEAGFDGLLCQPVADALKERGIPFVVCTCRDPASLGGAPPAGGIVLGKPFDWETLGTTLEAAMRRPHPAVTSSGGNSGWSM